MRVVVRVAYTDDDSTEQRVMISGLFRFLDVSAKDPAARATLRYGIAQELRAVLERSSRWERIKAEVFCAMRSKHGMALYKVLELRKNMDRCIETFTMDRFRELLGVEPDAYRIGFDFHRSVVERRTGSQRAVRHGRQDRSPPQALAGAVTMAWWCKSPEEMAAAIKERIRSKVGRGPAEGGRRNGHAPADGTGVSRQPVAASPRCLD